MIKQIDLVEYNCLVCGVIRKTQFRRIKPTGNTCTFCFAKTLGKMNFGSKRSIESRSKMSAKKIGKPSNKRGIKLSEEQRRKISESKKGVPSKNKGRIYNPDRAKFERIHDCCSGMVRRILKIKNEKKVYKTFDTLGYTKSDFINRIESMFATGMTWDNYGEWQVDHIRPVSSFVKSGILEVKVINALQNLQPLWKKDNLIKKDKYEITN